jgi:hypothetical protein
MYGRIRIHQPRQLYSILSDDDLIYATLYNILFSLFHVFHPIHVINSSRFTGLKVILKGLVHEIELKFLNKMISSRYK